MVEFSLSSYRELLSAFKHAGYAFCSFEETSLAVAETGLAVAETESHLVEERPFVVLRHDIDISLRPALEFARIEYEQDVQATYFVLLRSPFYNLFSRANAEIILQIHQLGHQIAAHIDPAAYNDDCTKALVEVELLAQLYPYINTRVVSLHSSYDLQHMPVDIYPQLDAVYGAAVRGEMAYISDSTGRWRYGHPLDSEAFIMRKPIQLLTHPIWWVQEGETSTQKLERWLYSDYLHSQSMLKEFLPKMFRLRAPARAFVDTTS